jgi:hypothetical protein
MKTLHSSPRNKGYSLVEALVASCLLGAMIGGAVALMGTMNLQERVSTSGTVAYNMQDCAAHLWQLGLTPAEALTVLPTNTNNEFVDNCLVAASSNSVAFGNATTTTLANSMGTLENISCTVTLRDPQGANNTRTNIVQAYRPVLR